METQSVVERAFYLLKHGYLSIDQQGQVWRCAYLSHGTWRQTEPRRAENVGGKGYLRVTLVMAGGKTRSVMAHRLVWEWLHGLIPPGMQVNHKDLNKTNNHPENLELLTGAGNIQHSYANGRPMPWHKAMSWRGKPRMTDADRREIRRLRREGEKLADIGKIYGLGTSHVHRICADAGKEGNGTI